MADTKLPALTEVSVPALSTDLAYLVDVSDTTDDASGSSRKVTLNRLLGLLAPTPGGRLTLTSGTPVTTSDVTTSTNVYYTPYLHNLIRIWDGTRYLLLAFSELTLALGAVTTNLPYDIFGYVDTGALALEKLAWTNGTTRATGLTRTDGILHKTGDQTRMYLGSIRTISTTETCDTGGGSTTQVGGKRFVFNMYNRVRRWLRVIETTVSWSYTTNTWRVANGATAPLNCVEWLDGVGDMLVTARINVNVFTTSTGGGRIGIGLGNTTPVGIWGALAGGDNYAPVTARYSGFPGVGYRDARWLERGSGSGTSNNVGQDSDVVQSGLDVVIWN
jgi:hypothetical protein